MDRERFCQCPCCLRWFSADDILACVDVEPIGMTFEYGDPESNLMYFNHRRPECGSTFTLLASRLEPFLPEKPAPEIRAGLPACEGHCVNIADLSLCQTECQWAAYRRFLLELRRRCEAQRSDVSPPTPA